MDISLDHIQLAMPKGEEAKAQAFYGTILQLTELPKPATLSGRGGVWFQLAGGQQLHLGVEEPFRPAAKAHPCFVVPDLNSLAERLRSNGYDVTYDTLNPPIVRFFSKDVFGNRLEFADRRSS